jgi:cytochrome oxidase Cu insertion factor (SCO1/SenC/PrrC family)
MKNHVTSRAAWLLFISTALTMVTGCRDAPAPSAYDPANDPNHPPQVEPPKFDGPPLTEFTLTDSGGENFGSQDLQGKVWVASFFFTQCAANCRALNMKISELQREFGDRGVEFVCISCDPQHDTPPVLAAYAEFFNAQPDQWHFLTGDMEYIQRVGHDKFDVPVGEKRHEDELLVIDRAGEYRGKFRARQPEQFERLKTLLEDLLAEPGAAAGAAANLPSPAPSSES